MNECLCELLQSGSTKLPIYNFDTHTREKETANFQCSDILIFEGTLILHSEKIRKLLDFVIFLDCPEEIRFKRRLSRDIKQRGRNAKGVEKQFRNQVAPMHDKFVQTGAQWAQLKLKSDQKLEKLITECLVAFDEIEIKKGAHCPK